MLFSRDIYKVGARCPFVYGRQIANATAGANATSPSFLYFSGLFANHSSDLATLPRVSPYHGIATRPSVKQQVYNFVNEIPKGTLLTKNADNNNNNKFGLQLATEHNPIIIPNSEAHGASTAASSATSSASRAKKTTSTPSASASNTKVLIENGGTPFNYGFLPRTFADPKTVDAQYAKLVSQKEKGAKNALISCYGDGGALDVIELSGSPLTVGMTSQVRLIGAMATTSTSTSNNNNKTAAKQNKNTAVVIDWKIIVADVYDTKLTSAKDISEEQLAALGKWLTDNNTNTYTAAMRSSSSSSSPSSASVTLAFGGKVLDASVAEDVIAAHIASYNALRAVAAAAKKGDGNGLFNGIWVPTPKDNPAFSF